MRDYHKVENVKQDVTLQTNVVHHGPTMFRVFPDDDEELEHLLEDVEFEPEGAE